MSVVAGLVTATVCDVDDPNNEGRIRVDISTMPGRSRTAWAPVASPMAGSDRGLCFMPEIGDEAIVGFMGNDPEQPIVLGYTWNGRDPPPTRHPRERIIKSWSGHTIRMIDEPPGPAGAGSLTIEDANGNVISLSNGKIRLDAVAMIEINAPMVSISGDGWRRNVSPVNTPI